MQVISVRGRIVALLASFILVAYVLRMNISVAAKFMMPELTPGSPHLTVPQVLTNLIEYGMDPYEASAAPRFWPLQENYSLEIESRVSHKVTEGLAAMGVSVKPLLMNEFHMGSFQICWRDPKMGRMNASADPRRCGKADGV
jgi:gamma-glutamyltranspeptidase/glutathione hydrolase